MNNCFLLLDCLFVCSEGLDPHAPPPLLPLVVENQRHTVALNMYYSVSTAQCVFTTSPVFTEIFLKRSKGKQRGKEPQSNPNTKTL